MLDNNLICDILTILLETGGDFAEIFAEHTIRNNVGVTNGICEKGVSGVDYGVGLRIFTGFNAIYVYTNDISRGGLTDIARQAAAAVPAAGTRGGSSYLGGLMKISVINNHPVTVMPDGSFKKKTVDILKRVHAASMAYDSLITQTSGSYGDVVSNILIANSDGLLIEDTRIRTRALFSVVAGDGGQKQTASQSIAALRGFELMESLDTADIAENISGRAVTMLKAKEAPCGRMPVVIDGGFGGVIFHEACGHSLEATSVAKGASVFCGKVGCKIASDVVTAIDDGALPHRYGSINIDDEGAASRHNVLIENGILKSYLVDRLNGLKMGAPSTGSSRRESYRYAPTSRMTNTFIAPGKLSSDEIISNTDYGLYAKKMGGGSVNPATGEYNFAVECGYMIRQGNVAEPVRGATLIGKGAQTLLDIDMVSSDLRLEPGTCGSASGHIPVSVGQPVIRVSELTVGGRG